MKINIAGRSRNARLNQTQAHLQELDRQLSKLREFPHNEYVDNKDAWQDARNAVEQLTQCFHEANAYNNMVKK